VVVNGALKVLHTIQRLDVVAVLGGLEQRGGDAHGLESVMITEEGLDGRGGLHGVVVRQLVEDVVADVRTADVVVQLVHNPGVGAVDRGQRAGKPVPRVLAVEGDVRVAVLQPRVEHEPPVDHHVGPKVEQRDRLEPDLGAGQGQQTQHARHAERGEQDLEAQLLCEQLVARERAEVVWLALIALARHRGPPRPGGVKDQV